MTTRSVLRASRPSDAVVRRIAPDVGRRCARPGCQHAAAATLSFSYDNRTAVIGGLDAEPDPAAYDLCGDCADRTSPPRGWQLADERPPVAPTPIHRSLDDRDTVAVLAAALHGDLERGEDGALPSTPDLPHGATARILSFPRGSGSADRVAAAASSRDAAARAAVDAPESAVREVPGLDAPVDGGALARATPDDVGAAPTDEVVVLPEAAPSATARVASVPPRREARRAPLDDTMVLELELDPGPVARPSDDLDHLVQGDLPLPGLEHLARPRPVLAVRDRT